MLNHSEVDRIVDILVSLMLKNQKPFSIRFSELLDHINHTEPCGSYDKICIHSRGLVYGLLISHVDSLHTEYFDMLYVIPLAQTQFVYELKRKKKR